MASKRIQGITIEIGGDSTKLQTALKGVDDQLKKTQDNLKDINKLLKLDPGNTELLTQKQKNLQSSIKSTEERLKTLKDAQKNATAPEDYDALQREIIETQQNLENLTKEYKNFGSVGAQQLQAAGDKIKGFGDKMGAVGGALTKYVTGPLMALGAGASAAYAEVDEGADKILVATGASGEALEDMEERMKSLATSIPTDFATAGDAIGAVNTRFGITGDALEELSGQYVKFAELNGSDVTNAVNSTQKALTAFGKSSKSAGHYLDVLTKVGQDTGISVDKLTDGVTANASAFQAMGMDLEEATVFMGNIEKSGADVTAVFGGLAKANKLAAKENKSMNAMLKDFQKKVKSGKKDAEAMTLAYEMFGKSGAQVFNAVKSGAIDFENLASATQDVGDVVSDTFEATLDPADRFKTAMNAVKVTGAEIAAVAMPAVSAALDKVRDVILKARDAWNGLSDGAKKAVMIVGGVAAALGPILTIGSKLVGGIGSAVGLIGKFAGALHIAAAPALAIVVAVGALVAIFVKLWKTNDRFRNKFISMWQMLKKQTLKTIDSLKEGFEGIKKNLEPVITSVKQIWEKFTQFMGRVFQARGAQITNAILSIQYIFRDLGKIISGLVSGDFSKVGEAFKHIGLVVKTYISTTIEWIKWVFKDIDWAELGSKILEGIKSALEGVKNFLTGIDWKGVGSTIWNAIKSGFAIVKGWLLKLVLGDDYTPESGWGDAGAKIWQSIKDGFAAVGDWLLKLVLGDDYTPESGWGDAGAKIWQSIKDGFAAVGDWLLKLVLGDDWTPDSGWGDAGAKIWGAIKNGFAAVGDWLLKLVMGDDWTPDSGWGDAGAKIWETIKTGFAAVGDWLLKLVLGDDYTPDSGWGDAGAKIWETIKTGFAAVGDWLIKLVMGDDWTPESGWSDVGAKIWGKIKEGFGTIGEWFASKWEDTKQAVSEIPWRELGDTIWGGIKEAFKEGVQWVDDKLDSVSKALDTAIQNAKDWFVSLGEDINDGWNTYFQPVVNWLNDKFNGAIEAIQPALEGITTFLNDVFSGNWEKAWNSIVDLFARIFGKIGDKMKEPINAVIDGINWMIDKLEGAVNTVIGGINDHLRVTVPDWVPFWGGNSWYPGLNKVRWGRVDKLMANGGILGEGQRAIVGEFAPEYLRVVNGRAVVTPMTNQPSRMGGDTTVNITINAQPGQSAEDIAAAVKRVFVREMEQRSAAYA